MLETVTAEAIVAALVLFRVSGLLLVAPVLGSRPVPISVRAAFGLLLVAVSLPAALPPPAPAAGLGALLGEMVVGLGIGLGALTLVAGVELAGELLGIQTGLSSATALDPLSGHGSAALNQLLQMLVVLMMLVTDGHLYMIEALARSFAVVPVGTLADLETGLLEAVRTAGLLFAHGLQFAAPIVVASLLGYVALGALSRAAPQLNVLAVAFPLQIGLGLLALAILLPLMSGGYAMWPARLATLVERFIAALVTGSA